MSPKAKKEITIDSPVSPESFGRRNPLFSPESPGRK
jgi:hypothetical protein